MSMAVLARKEIKIRRERRYVTVAVTEATRALVERARAVDEAVARGRAARCKQETTADEDDRLERDEAACWEAHYVAAVAYDALVANVTSPVADRMLFYAQLFGPLEGGWTPYANRTARGTIRRPADRRAHRLRPSDCHRMAMSLRPAAGAASARANPTMGSGQFESRCGSQKGRAYRCLLFLERKPGIGSHLG